MKRNTVSRYRSYSIPKASPSPAWARVTSSQTAACSSLPGSGKVAVPVSAAGGGLAAAHVYHFRVVATNAFGTSAGKDKTFKTTA